MKQPLVHVFQANRFGKLGRVIKAEKTLGILICPWKIEMKEPKEIADQRFIEHLIGEPSVVLSSIGTLVRVKRDSWCSLTERPS